jgi:hypothetical protein
LLIQDLNPQLNLTGGLNPESTTTYFPAVSEFFR